MDMIEPGYFLLLPELVVVEAVGLLVEGDSEPAILTYTPAWQLVANRYSRGKPARVVCTNFEHPALTSDTLP